MCPTDKACKNVGDRQSHAGRVFAFSQGVEAPYSRDIEERGIHHSLQERESRRLQKASRYNRQSMQREQPYVMDFLGSRVQREKSAH